MLALADDSGIEVDPLGGAPGVWSARFGGPELDDAGRTALLLERLHGVPPPGRTARYRCVIALVWPDGRERTVEGTAEGVITVAPRCAGGFGYDPVTCSYDLDQLAEGLPSWRNASAAVMAAEDRACVFVSEYAREIEAFADALETAGRLDGERLQAALRRAMGEAPATPTEAPAAAVTTGRSTTRDSAGTAWRSMTDWYLGSLIRDAVKGGEFRITEGVNR